MPFTDLSTLWDTIGVPSTESVIADATTFISFVLPPAFCYFTMAVLVITPQTRAIRVALCPVLVLLALRVAIPLDIISLKKTGRKIHNDLAIWMYVFTSRALGWAFSEQPLVRQLRPVNSSPSILFDALDLTLNLRGHGWDWSRGVHIPRETRPSNRTGFIFYTLMSAALNAFIYVGLYGVLRAFSRTGSGEPEFHSIFHSPICTFIPVGYGENSAGTIFDESLPFYLRFLRSSLISFLALVWFYTALQVPYNLFTIIGVLLLVQDPAQWPPAFDAPWRSTTLSEFWGRRWHQWLRDLFLVQAGRPLSFLFGRIGYVVGAFFASVMFHYIGLVSFNTRGSFWRMLVGYGMMAPGIIIEHVFKYVTGRSVQGMLGWLWTMSWILLWGHMIVEGYARAGMFGYMNLIDLVPSVRVMVENLVTEFDALLHTVSAMLHSRNVTIR